MPMEAFIGTPHTEEDVGMEDDHGMRTDLDSVGHCVLLVGLPLLVTPRLLLNVQTNLRASLPEEWHVKVRPGDPVIGRGGSGPQAPSIGGRGGALFDARSYIRLVQLEIVRCYEIRSRLFSAAINGQN
jgi:hypothetical protein